MNINNNIELFYIIIKFEYYVIIIDLFHIIQKKNINNNIDLLNIIIKNEY